MLFDGQNYYLFLDFLFLKGIFRFPICKNLFPIRKKTAILRKESAVICFSSAYIGIPHVCPSIRSLFTPDDVIRKFALSPNSVLDGGFYNRYSYGGIPRGYIPCFRSIDIDIVCPAKLSGIVQVVLPGIKRIGLHTQTNCSNHLPPVWKVLYLLLCITFTLLPVKAII